MSKTKPTHSEEETAASWPPADYREWVQTNIANKMIGRLFAGGITVISLAAGMVIWIQDSSIKNIQMETQSKLSELELELRGQIDSRIDNRIESKLTTDEKLKDDLFNAIKIQIEAYIETEEYREEVRTAIIQDQTLEDLIRERGITIAQSAESPHETRKLGIQLYGLFQPMDAVERETFRTNLVSILEKEDSFSELSATILELYNFQECEDFRFAGTDNTCKSNDRRAVTAGVVLYGSTTDASAKEYIADWLAEVPIAHAYILTNALARDLDESAEPLLASLASRARPDLVEQVALGLAERAALDDATAHDTILAFLSWLPGDLALTRQARIELALWMWNHVDQADLHSAFLPPETESDDAEARGTRSAMLKSAFVNLLRTSGPPIAPDGLSSSHIDNDWEHLLLNALELGRDPARDAILLNAWASRIGTDRQRGIDVAWGAQRMLRHYIEARELLATTAAYAGAVEAAAWPDVKAFADAYIERTSALRAENSILQAILDQDGRDVPEHNKATFDWLRPRVAADATHGSPLLSVALFSGEKEVPPSSSHRWHRALAATAARSNDASTERGTDVLATICRDEVMRRITSKSDAERWPMVTALESILLAADPPTESLLDTDAELVLPWLNQAPPAPATVVEIDSSAWNIAEQATNPDLTAHGGIWRAVTVAAESWVTYSPPPNVTLAAFHTSVSRFLGANEPGEPLELHLEPKQAYLLVARPHGRNDKLDPVRIELRPFLPQVSPNTPETAFRIVGAAQQLEFVADEAGGEVWLGVSVADQELLVVETSRSDGSQENPDTEIHLLDTETNEQLAYNDDAEATRFSRLGYRSTGDAQALVRITQFGGNPIAAGTRFNIRVEKIRISRDPLTLPLTRTVDATAGQLWRSAFIPAGHILTIEAASASDDQIGIDANVRLLGMDGAVLAQRDASGAPGPHAALRYVAMRDTPIIVHVYGGGAGAPPADATFRLKMDLQEIPSRDIGPTSREEPLPLDISTVSLNFDAGDEGGFGWYHVHLDAGDTIEITTGASDNGQSVDTMVYLRDPDKPEPLAFDDDSAGSGFSRLRYVAKSSVGALIEVSPFTGFGTAGAPFASGTRFSVNIDISG